MRVKSPSGIIMRIAVILLCLVLFSAHLASGMLAKYTVGGTGGATAKTAKIDLKVQSEQTALASGQYSFKVVNDSEVAFQYEVIVNFPNLHTSTTQPLENFNVENYFKDLKLKDASGNELTGTVSSDKRTYTFTIADPIELDSEDSYTLSFTPLSRGQTVATPARNYGHLYILDYEADVYVKAVQVD